MASFSKKKAYTCLFVCICLCLVPLPLGTTWFSVIVPFLCNIHLCLIAVSIAGDPRMVAVSMDS